MLCFLVIGVIFYITKLIIYFYFNISGNGVEFCLNFRALFYLVIPAVLVKMAARDNWRGCYEALVPHCVALSWWQIAITASEG